MYSTPLNDVTGGPAKRDWMRIGMGVCVVATLLNLTLTTALISQLAVAQAKVDKYDAMFSQAQAMIELAKPQVKFYMGEFNHSSKQARQLGDYANRFIHGSIPDLTNDIAQSDWAKVGFNVSTLAGSISKAFDTSHLGTYNENINQIASLVQSVATIISKIDPHWTLPAPQPTDDAGFLNTFSYLIDWVDEQADKTKWRNTAVSCVDLLDTVIPLDWSGKYVWHAGKRWDYFDWNYWISSNLPQARDTCAYFANMKLSNTTGDGF